MPVRDLSSFTDRVGLGVLFLFYGSSLVTFTMMYEIGWLDTLMKLTRFACYGAMALLVLYWVTGMRSISSTLSGLWTFIKEHVLFDIMFVVSALSCVMARVIEPVVLLLLVLYCSHYSFRTVCKVFVGAAALVYAVTVLLAMTGAISSLTFLRKDTLRYALGFIYPLEAQSLYFFAALGALYAYGRQYRWPLYLGIEALNLVLFWATRARFSFLLLSLLVLLFLVLDVWHQKQPAQPQALCQSKGFQIFSIICILVLFVVPNLFSLFYDSSQSWMAATNQLFNDRFLLGFNAYRDYSVNPFGSLITWIGFGSVTSVDVHIYELQGYNYVDISYIKNLFDYGWVYMIFACAMYLWGVLHNESAGKWQLVLIIAAAMIMSLFEPRLLQISVNIAIPACGLFFLQTNQQVRAMFRR